MPFYHLVHIYKRKSLIRANLSHFDHFWAEKRTLAFLRISSRDFESFLAFTHSFLTYLLTYLFAASFVFLVTGMGLIWRFLIGQKIIVIIGIIVEVKNGEKWRKISFFLFWVK